MADRARLFVAVIPPEPVLDVIEALDRPTEPGVRYTTRDQWHITLRFLGDAAVDAAVAALRRIWAEPTEAVLGPAVARLGRSVVVVPVAGLDALAAATIDATATVGEPPEPRLFAGHLTLARLRHRPACGIAGQPLRARFPVDEVHLVRSRLDPDGARYEVIASHGLLGSGAGPAA